MKAKRSPVILLVVALTALLFGAYSLIQMRFDSGDVYSSGSSFRPDPLGAKALFEAYARTPGLTVERNFRPFEEMEHLSPDAVLLFLNTSAYALYDLLDGTKLESFVENGGRIIVALDSSSMDRLFIVQEEDVSESEDDDTSVQSITEIDSAEFALLDGLELSTGDHEGGFALHLTEDAVLPEKLPWREGGVLTLENEDESWQILYRIGDESVAAERSVGLGSVVVLTDSFLFTNEALLQHREVGLLAWIVRGKQQVIFDETHLGVLEKTGVAGLMRRYRLTGFFVAAGFLFLLMIWRGGNPLLPTYSKYGYENLIRTEQSTESGLADLIRRNIDSLELPGEAFRRWKASMIQSRADAAHWATELEEIDTLFTEYGQLSSRNKRPAELHLKIQTIINRKTRKRS